MKTGVQVQSCKELYTCSYNTELFKKDNKHLFLSCKERFLVMTAIQTSRRSKETQQVEDAYQKPQSLLKH